MAASSPSPLCSPSSSPAGATGSSVHDSSKEKTNFTRLARLLIDGGTEALRKFLDSIYPPRALDNVLKKNRAKFQYLKTFDDQWEKLFPPSGDLPDSKTFDITLLHLLIREVCYLPAPLTGWHKMPADDDDSLEANITRIKCFRNELCHSVSTCIPNDEFEDKWNKIASSLETIEIGACRQKIQGLKNDTIDDDTRQLVEEQLEQWRKFQQQEELGSISQLDSHLPDMPPVFGRLKELKQVREYVESGDVSVVLITGGPGFGKTTVAKTVAHDLANQDNERTVLFCRLLSKKTFNEVATAMIHSCGKIHTQLPENPAQWLKDWSKQIQMHVTFVLDNADGVLVETEDRYSFLSILSTMGELSKQKVTFVITSRKTFKHPDLRSKDVRLDPLSPEEAKKILISRVNEEKIRKKLSKTEEIVDLCGCVPLALCIVGSLLSDYTEEKLIKHLKEEPMAVLEDDDESVRTAIKTSFDLLTKPEQDALIVMSMFQGSFNCDAAEVVIKACSDSSGTLPVSILRSLKNRSLVEQPSSRRYQLHPLIRAFVKKIGQTDDQNDPQVLDVGKKLACAHFMSRLDDNANMFWSKDTCKTSIESFNEDRPNFEQFLQVYCQGMENHDQEIADSCKGFLEDLPQKCMYLEKCVQPKFYIVILQGLLKSFDRKIQPVHVVELLCLLGHEMRKVGEKTKYNDYMEQAIQLYKKNFTEFETMALSKVIYLHSCARFLSEKNVLNDPGPKKIYDIALKICKTKIPDHPETAATLLFAGRNAKRRKDNNEAVEKFKQALALFRKRLGDHFMTAQCLKDIADFLLFAKTDNHLKSLSYYKEALIVMENLGMDCQKESILMLKNYGVCHKRNGNFEEAICLLQRAERVAEIEIEGDHKWKVMVKTEQAILYHEEAIKKGIESSTRKSLEDQMEASMKEGLLMCYKVGDRTIEQLGNKHLIRKILADYPKRFPEKEYPRK